MNGILLKLAVLVSALILSVGCSNSDSLSSKSNGENKSSVHDNQKNKETIQTYLKNEFTGPSEELKKLFNQFFSEDPTALNAYIKEKYKSLIPEEDYQTFVNTNEAFRWLLPAYQAGYQLKIKNSEIQKVNNNNAYTFKVEVEYSKEGETKTAAVTGYINMNDNGKISAIRDINDGGFAQNMMLSAPKGQ